MEKAFKCNYDSDEKLDCISRFFEEEELRALFIKVSATISEAVQNLELRGKEQKIIGVSQPDQRYIFYVVPSQNAYAIKFKSKDRVAFSESYSESLIQLAKEECDLYKHDPYAYCSMIPHSSSHSNGNVQDVAAVIPRFDTEPFFKRYGVDPDAFGSLETTQASFSVRAYNCLGRAGITTLSQLFRTSEQELSEIPNLGRRTLSEIEERIHAMVSLGANPQEDGHRDNNSGEEDNQSIALSLQDRSRVIRTDIHDLILRAGDVEGALDVRQESCDVFRERLESWAVQLITDIPKLNDRARNMFIFRNVHGETLLRVGERFDVTRERVRQICIKTYRRILARAHQFPDERILDDLSQFGDILRETSADELYTLLSQTMKKRKLLFDLLLAIFIPKGEQADLTQKIGNAVLPVEQRPLKVKKERMVQPPQVPAVPTGRYCPRCGVELLVRTVRRGENAGRRFIGCSSFPRCWYTEELSSEESSIPEVGVDS